MSKLPMSSRQAVRFTPAIYEGRENAPVFLLKPPTMLERTRFRQRMTEEGFRFVTDGAMIELLRDMVASLTDDELKADWSGVIDRIEAQLEADGEPSTDPSAEPPGWAEDLIAAKQTLEGMARRHWRPFAEAAAARAAYAGAMPIVLFQMFCTGWENCGVRYARSFSQVSDEAMAALPEADVMAAGWRISALMQPTGRDAKNSAAPSPSGSGQEISATAPTTAQESPSTAAPDGSLPVPSSTETQG